MIEHINHKIMEDPAAKIREELAAKAVKRKEEIIIEALSRVRTNLAKKIKKANKEKDFANLKKIMQEHNFEIKNCEDIPGLIYSVDDVEFLRILEPAYEMRETKNNYKSVVKYRYEFLN